MILPIETHAVLSDTADTFIEFTSSKLTIVISIVLVLFDKLNIFVVRWF